MDNNSYVQMEVTETTTVSRPSTSNAPKPIKKRYLELTNNKNAQTNGANQENKSIITSQQAYFLVEPNSACVVQASLSTGQKESLVKTSTQCKNKSTKFTSSNFGLSIPSSHQMVCPRPIPSSLSESNTKKKAIEHTTDRYNDESISSNKTRADQIPFNGLIDPIMFDQDALGRIIESALSDKTNSESSAALRSANATPAKQSSNVRVPTSIHINSSNLTTRPDVFSAHHTSLTAYSSASALPSNANLMHPSSVYTTANHPTPQNGYHYLSGVPSSMSYNHHRAETYPFHVDMVTMAVFHNENNDNGDRRRNQKIQLRRRSSSTSALAPNPDEPVDFSITKTYAQTSQNIINNVIDKLLANDNSRVMLLA